MADHKPKDQPEPETEAEDAAPAARERGGGRRLAIVLAVPALVLLAGFGAWAAGLLPFASRHAGVAATPGPPVFVDLPEMIANLDSDPRRPRYVKLRARLEVADQRDAAMVEQVMPRLQDLFQTYLRDMRPEDLRGSMGTYRLREELVNRADLAAAPAKIVNVLFVEMIMQ